MGAVTPDVFLRSMRWIDGTPLVLEPYRQRLFEQFHARDGYGRVQYSLGLDGRAKKNHKTTDLDLHALYALFDDSPHGSQVYIVANDEGQAADDLDLLKKLIKANPALKARTTIKKRTIERKDGGGFIEILPAQDAIGSHGKTFRLLAVDEIHGYRNWDLLEALAPDPTRHDTQTWITSYASVFHRPGVPLFDLLQLGRGGTDPRMLFSWYAADFCTDPAFAAKTPEERANPSMASWDNPEYLAQQRRRLPAHKYRRLHLNLPGLPEGSAYSAEPVMDAIARGLTLRKPEPGVTYVAFVDMSGGSSDDAVLAIGHTDADGRAVLDRMLNQGPHPPFDPRKAVDRFVAVLREYHVAAVTGDKYAGETFVSDFATDGIAYHVSRRSKSELYEALEPELNARMVTLVDAPTLEQQLLGLVWRGGRIDHPGGEHDDWANACAGVCVELLDRGRFDEATFNAALAVGRGSRNEFSTRTLL
jgi:hypothetical protein